MSGFPTSIDGKISFAEGLKNEANELFKAGDLKKARSTYAKVFSFTRGLPGSTFDKQHAGSFDTSQYLDADEERITPEQEKQCVVLEVNTRNNLATICIKQKKAENAVDHCDHALHLDKDNWKAHLRHGQAKAMLHELESARFSLLRAKSLAPEANKACAALELNRVMARQKEESVQAAKVQRKRMQGAFEKMENEMDVENT